MQGSLVYIEHKNEKLFTSISILFYYNHHYHLTMTASNVLSKHKDLRKEMIGLMNKHHGTLSLIEIKKRIPALNDMTAMLVSQVYGKHNKAAKRLGGHFKEALANTKSGGMVFNVDEDDEELEDDDRKPEAMPGK